MNVLNLKKLKQNNLFMYNIMKKWSGPLAMARALAMTMALCENCPYSFCAKWPCTIFTQNMGRQFFRK